jgi:hypothetical protein
MFLVSMMNEDKRWRIGTMPPWAVPVVCSEAAADRGTYLRFFLAPIRISARSASLP